MQSTANTFIDFDGTLVYENSSQVLIDHLLSQANSPSQRALARLLNSRLRWLVTKTLGVATRLTGKDTMLRLVLMVFRSEISESADEIFAAVAQKLHLNTKLSAEHSRPFTILSVGLQPLIEQFLLLHPELNCARAIGSSYKSGSRNSSPVIKTVNHKIIYLSRAKQIRYYTDYKHEADTFKAELKGSYSIMTIPNTRHKTLYLLEEHS